MKMRICESTSLIFEKKLLMNNAIRILFYLLVVRLRAHSGTTHKLLGSQRIWNNCVSKHILWLIKNVDCSYCLITDI